MRFDHIAIGPATQFSILTDLVASGCSPVITLQPSMIDNATGPAQPACSSTYNLYYQLASPCI